VIVDNNRSEVMRVEMRLGDFVFQDSMGKWAQWLVSDEERPRTHPDGTEVKQRTMEEVKESTSFGRLYVVRQINGPYAVCFRVRRVKGALKVDKKDKVTMLIKGVLQSRGDFLGGLK